MTFKKLALITALLIAVASVGLLMGAWTANATTWTSPAKAKTTAEDYTPFKIAQAGGCPTGFSWRCDLGGACKCRAQSGQ
jgi:hypothetical protein